MLTGLVSTLFEQGKADEFSGVGEGLMRPRPPSLAWLSLAFLVTCLHIDGAASFAFRIPPLAGRVRDIVCRHGAEGESAEWKKSVPASWERRHVLKQLVTLSGLALTSSLPVGAVVPFDSDRYGDKELKIATVNKLRQKLRNAIAQNPKLAVQFLRLAVNDGIGYDSQSTAGGPDGSILFELDAPQNEGLREGLSTLIKVKQEVQATNELTLADIVAFAGAAAIEAVGGPRISVQVGRYDAKESNPSVAVDGYAWSKLTGPGIRLAMSRAGLGAREGALFFGAIGGINLAVQGGDDAGSGDGETDFIDEQPFIPSTFGSSADIYGATIGNGKLDNTYLARVAKGLETGMPQMDKALVEDPQVKAFVQKYSTNNGAFLKDLSEAYQKLTTLGFVGTTRNS